MIKIFAAVLLAAWLGMGCASSNVSPVIELDLTRLDEQGLRGPANGKVALAYEFAIPDTEACRTEVQSIDSSVRFIGGSPGRVGAGDGQCLCIGETHQPNYRTVLYALAELPYITRIIRCDFE